MCCNDSPVEKAFINMNYINVEAYIEDFTVPHTHHRGSAQAPNTFRLNLPSQQVIWYRWLAFLSPVQKYL